MSVGKMDDEMFLEPDEVQVRADQLLNLAAAAIGEKENPGGSLSIQAASDAVTPVVKVPVVVMGETPPTVWVERPDAEEWLEVGPRWNGAIIVVAVVRGRRYSAHIDDSGEEVSERAAEGVARFRELE